MIEKARELVAFARSFGKTPGDTAMLDYAEALVELSGSRPNEIDRRRVDLGCWFRAAGDAECAGWLESHSGSTMCGRPYHEHPVVPGFEWLRRLCNGKFVKL
jgi:hypothetical protein